MSFTRAVVIGQSGQVSRALGKALAGKEILFTSSSGKDNSLPLDLGDDASIARAFATIEEKFGRGNLEVFLAGAMTHVDRCEQERDRCHAINELGPAAVALECKKRNYGLTYFSTEYIFGEDEYHGGKVGPFTEEDPPHPSSWYGQCKLGAEEAIQRNYGPGALILRTTMVYSWDEAGMNFLMQYIRHLEERALGGEKTFRIPVDQISTPAYAPDLAAAAVRLREDGVSGIFNLVGPDLLSRRELVEKVAANFNLGSAEQAFIFVKTAELGQAARRPLTAGLTQAKAKRYGLRLRSLDEAFAEVKALRKS